MDNGTMTCCTLCGALIMYDKDADEPKLCAVCEKKLAKQDNTLIDVDGE